MQVKLFIKPNTKMDKIHKSILRLDTEKKQDISYEKRDTLIKFNIDSYWWCFYDQYEKVLYDQFCCKIDINAKEYLIGIGVLDSDNNKIKISDFY